MGHPLINHPLTMPYELRSANHLFSGDPRVIHPHAELSRSAARSIMKPLARGSLSVITSSRSEH